MGGCYNRRMSQKQPLVISFVADLMFSSKIELAVQQLGFCLQVIDSAEFFGESTQKEQLGEPLNSGQTSQLTRFLTEQQPGLLIFHLNNAHIPWQTWLPIIKTSPATRRIPALAFGPHVDKAMLDSAASRGADVVISNGQFSSQASKLIKKHTKQYDLQAIASGCEGELSDLGKLGIKLFNEGDYFDAHEELEHAWNEDKSAARDFYRAVLQVAVAYLQIERGNYRGAVKMFLRVRQWLNQLPDSCHGVDLAQLRTDAETVHAAVLTLGPDNISDFNMESLQPVVFTNQ